MRDIFVTAIVIGSLPFILKRPYIGVLMWIWLSVMNPHRLTWGFAYEQPFAQIVGITLLVGFLLSSEPKRMPWCALVTVWMLFVFWMCVTTAAAFYPGAAQGALEKSMKIQIPVFLALMLMHSRHRLNLMVWVVTLSLAFFGTKGGVFTVLHGGEYLVWGPKGTFISGNNELALALVTIIPLLRFLQLQAGNRWVRWGLLASLLLCTASVIGSSSRGAFLALGAMGLFLLWKSPRKAPILAILIVVVPLIVAVAPDKYWARMNTITTYEEDASATGRINAWTFAINLANNYPIMGGGFNTFQPRLFALYAPDPGRVHVAHSNYFQVLAEHGYVGLFLYLMMALLAWLAAGSTLRAAKREDDLLWNANLARMCQVSLIGYSVGGAFLSLPYFDLYYYLLAIVVLNRQLVVNALRGRAASQPRSAVGFAPGLSGRAGRAAMHPGPNR